MPVRPMYLVFIDHICGIKTGNAAAAGMLKQGIAHASIAGTYAAATVAAADAAAAAV